MAHHKNWLRAGAGALCLGAALAAQAQTEFTPYGVLDFSYGRFEASGALPVHRFNHNSLSASFVGVNLKHGFDDGWTPGITLESFLRFQDFKGGRKDTDPLFSRNAFVSLGSRYGTLRVGRLQTFLFDTTARFNALGNSVAFSPAMRHVFGSGNLEGVQGDFYWNRAVSYQSPANQEGVLQGVSLNLMYAQGPKHESGDLAGGSVVVSRGLLAFALSAQRVHVANGIDDPTNETTWQLGATYNFGIARVFALYPQTNDRGLDVDSHIASGGFTYPIGPGIVQAQVAYTTTKGPAVDRRHTTASAAYVYAYDSVTDLYVIGMDDRVRGQTRGVSAAVGVRWRF
jgi:predicted porin